jgi:ligand-binding sensor domain-containing protein
MGLYHTEGTAWRLVLLESQVGFGTTLRAVVQVQPDEVWLGTSSGLVRYDPVADVVISPVTYPLYSPVNALAYDTVNRLMWAGSSEGLFALQRAGDGWKKDRKLTTSFRDSGLASREILSLTVDARDFEHTCLWIGTSCGLSRFEYEPI